MRHGQSTWNAERRWQGQADPPLSDLGRSQAVLGAARLPRLDLITSSPQQRALESAELLAAEYSRQRQTPANLPPVLVVPELQERSAGPWSGLTKEEIEVAYPGFLELDQRPDGYESDESLLARTLRGLGTVMASLDRVAASEQPEPVALVLCHGGVINNFQAFLGVQAGRVPNLAGLVVCRQSDRWVPGEKIFLLDEELRTGGDSNRL